jgi:hypothetical protein
MSLAAKSLVEVVHPLEVLFDRHDIRRSYGGAIARNFYAPPRLTRDIDVLALVSQLRLPALVQDLISAGWLAVFKDGTTGSLDFGPVLRDLRSKGWMTAIQ